MSRKRDNTSQGKPPASRLSLAKVKGKPGTSGSIAIRFNAASVEDDYDLDDDLTISGNGGNGRSRGDSVKFEIGPDENEFYSRSAPSSTNAAEDATPGSSAASNTTTPVAGEKSLLSGLKERFHDKLPEPINAFIEKIEVRKDASPDDGRKKFQKSDSQDSESSAKMSQSNSLDRMSLRKSDSLDATRGMPSRTSSLKGSMQEIASKNRSRQGSTEKEVTEVSGSDDDALIKTDSCMEVVEDYYNEEASADTKSSTFSVGKSASTEPLVSKQKSSLRKLISQKDRGQSPSREVKTMTLSGLLSSKSDDSIHSHTTTSKQSVSDEKPDTEVFYDVESEDTSKIEKEIDKTGVVKEHSRSTNVHKYLTTVVCFVAYALIPMSSFVSGIVVGAAMMYSVVLVYQWLYAPAKPKEPFVIPNLSALPPLVVPHMKESRNTDGKFQAWMNELQKYNPDDYHINLTVSVYVTLDGTNLRLQRPKVNVPKRAMWDEPTHNPTFIHQRHYDLKGSRVFLEPAGLVRKRLWSKKYPICIAFSNNAHSNEWKKTTMNRKDSADSSQKEESSVDSEKKLITQASFDDETLRAGEKKEKKLVVQMSLDDERLQQLGPENIDFTTSGEKDTTDDTENLVKESSSMESYELVSREECDTKIIYLFARTGREKEEWYRRLTAASQDQPWPTRMSALLTRLASPVPSPVRSTSPAPDSAGSQLRKRHSSSSLETLPSIKQHQRQGSADSATFSPTDLSPTEPSNTTPTKLTFPKPQSPPSQPQNLYEFILADYLRYMSVVLPAEKSGGSSRASSPVGNAPKSDKDSMDSASSSGSERCEPYCVWVNTFLSRCFWDFLREPYWREYMKQKIQRKLSKIHVPFFIDELTVTDIVLGSELPIIRRMSRPYLDDRGLWMDMDVTYNGGFRMSLETKVNLMKLKKEASRQQPTVGSQRQASRKSAVLNEDEEDSAESSTDEEAEVTTYVTTSEAEASGGSAGKKLLRFVDKLTQNKYFQQATENKYVKRAMKGVSNTPLMLNVELKSLIGRFTVNIPPPPTDRVWYGFRGNPKLWLSAKPKVGERAVTVTHVTEWIEKKLALEFQRVLVMPNMDDLPIPLMFDNLPDCSPTFESAL